MSDVIATVAMTMAYFFIRCPPVKVDRPLCSMGHEPAPDCQRPLAALTRTPRRVKEPPTSLDQPDRAGGQDQQDDDRKAHLEHDQQLDRHGQWDCLRRSQGA